MRRRTVIGLLLAGAVVPPDEWLAAAAAPPPEPTESRPPAASLAGATVGPPVLVWDSPTLATNRRLAWEHAASPQPAVDRLQRDAEKVLNLVPPSVMDKPILPPSGDKHDYMSLAPYFWPNPNTPNHLPYVRRDGEHNPEASGANTDAPRFSRLAGGVETLSLAFYLTGRAKYAVAAVKLLRTWFLNPASRMYPNLNYAQAIRGVNDGRGTGIIESERLVPVVDSIHLLRASPALLPADLAGLKAWMGQYLQWLLTSKNGRDEARAHNNHGTYFDVQVMALALFTGQDVVARRVAQAAPQKRTWKQIEPDGRMPLELARTKSLSYSVFNLTALLNLATLADHVGVDLWNSVSPDGRGIRKAVEFLTPYADPQKPWPYRQIQAVDRATLIPPLARAAAHYHDAGWAAMIEQEHRRDPALRTWLTTPFPGV